ELIALTGRLLKAITIQYGDHTPMIPNQFALLKHLGGFADAGPLVPT
ncbi:MAG: hypothetical protein JWL65_5187, partial [Gammaproteobacteria bacterium]|nr:hypothetical protein [Gammaproteobacteria bacterium]